MKIGYIYDDTSKGGEPCYLVDKIHEDEWYIYGDFIDSDLCMTSRVVVNKVTRGVSGEGFRFYLYTDTPVGVEHGILEQFELIRAACDYGKTSHDECNHMYGDKPYSHHLKMVFDFAVSLGAVLTRDELVVALAACWIHDVIEDARKTYNDVAKVLGTRVADVAYALSNEKGKTRDERANDAYYAGIKADDVACFVKICDRLANMKHSRDTGNKKMMENYANELEGFIAKLYNPRFERMFELLRSYKAI